MPGPWRRGWPDRCPSHIPRDTRWVQLGSVGREQAEGGLSLLRGDLRLHRPAPMPANTSHRYGSWRRSPGGVDPRRRTRFPTLRRASDRSVIHDLCHPWTALQLTLSCRATSARVTPFANSSAALSRRVRWRAGRPPIVDSLQSAIPYSSSLSGEPGNKCSLGVGVFRGQRFSRLAMVSNMYGSGRATVIIARSMFSNRGSPPDSPPLRCRTVGSGTFTA